VYRIDGSFSGCNCSTQTLQTLEIMATFVMRNVNTHITLADAHKMYTCSMDAACFLAEQTTYYTGIMA